MNKSFFVGDLLRTAECNGNQMDEMKDAAKIELNTLNSKTKAVTL